MVCSSSSSAVQAIVGQSDARQPQPPERQESGTFAQGGRPSSHREVQEAILCPLRSSRSWSGRDVLVPNSGEASVPWDIRGKDERFVMLKTFEQQRSIPTRRARKQSHAILVETGGRDHDQCQDHEENHLDYLQGSFNKCLQLGRLHSVSRSQYLGTPMSGRRP